MRALAAGSLCAAVASDLLGLAEVGVSPEPPDPLLNIRGPRSGLGSDGAAFESDCRSDGDTKRGLGLRASRGEWLLPESTLEDLT